LLLHLLEWLEPATNRLQGTPVLSKQVVYLAISARERGGRRSRQGRLPLDAN
jgi:hypothetical protein